jgi:hypothetical protein
VSEHRSSERGFYDKLQQPEFAEARELLERLLADKDSTYEVICRGCKSSGLFEALKDVTPQDLTRYRQRQARAEERSRITALIESDAQVIIDGAAKNPSGPLAQLLRRQLTQHVVSRFDEEMGQLDALALSREAARHALVEQRDRKLDIDQEKAELERRRIELAERQAELQRDRLGIAAKTWQIILQWLASEEPAIVDVLTRRSEELLVYLGETIEGEVV